MPSISTSFLMDVLFLVWVVESYWSCAWAAGLVAGSVILSGKDTKVGLARLMQSELLVFGPHPIFAGPEV